MYYDEKLSILRGKEAGLTHALDQAGFDLRQAWTSYSRKGREADRDKWLGLLTQYNQLAKGYEEVQALLIDVANSQLPDE